MDNRRAYCGQYIEFRYACCNLANLACLRCVRTMHVLPVCVLAVCACSLRCVRVAVCPNAPARMKPRNLLGTCKGRP